MIILPDLCLEIGPMKVNLLVYTEYFSELVKFPRA